MQKEGEEPALFLRLLLTFRTSGLAALGYIPDPLTGERKQDLERARETISFLEMLETKTKGNLAPEEERELADVLYELRLGYLRELQGK